MVYEVEVRVRPITQWCPDCGCFKDLECHLTFEIRTQTMIGDYTVCECGRVLWRWEKEEGLDPIVYSTPRKPLPKKQLKLF